MAKEKNRVKHSTIKQLFYNILGSISLLFAFIGVILPVVPTTPFVLISAACYYKGSKKIHNWLQQNKVFGPIIRDYEEHGGMRKNSKIRALTIMWIAVTLSTFLILQTLFMRVIVILIAAIGTVVMLRVKTIE
jgi:hypothetical protein